eukprot:CAMPEP_0178449898 /NCGR_PEP_ID=MMETSP0689_2-20121128/42818_1 /TAXON_ID=160604 /ORGANISM="Amphidinium massartii, Strain CS-259" /LENGTH=979 /DNA_ID=CAMNT_0020075291 /DNA_START=1 /DNA_END=2937 /DNA_ORIENTATION=+
MITAREDHLKVLVRDTQEVLGHQALEYVVVSDHGAPVQASPSTVASNLGHLEKGDLVKGYPAGRWLFLEPDEVARLSTDEQGEAADLASSAWVLIDGATLGKGTLLEPCWSQLRVEKGRQEALELSWSGVCRDSRVVQYKVHSQAMGADGLLEKEVLEVGLSEDRVPSSRSSVVVSAPRTASSLQVWVVATISEPICNSSESSDAVASASTGGGRVESAVEFEGAVATINFRQALSFLRGGSGESDSNTAVSPQDATGRLRRKTAVHKTEDLWRSRQKVEESLKGKTVVVPSKKMSDECDLSGLLSTAKGAVRCRVGGCGGGDVSVLDIAAPPMPGGPNYVAPFEIAPTGDLLGRATHTTISGCDDLSAIPWWSMFHACDMISKFGHEGGDEPLVRVLLAEANPPFFLMELNSVSTFNMMDPGLTGDVNWAITCIRRACTKNGWSNMRPMAHVTSGAGPHFCPGGNPNPKNFPGLTVAQGCSYTNYLGFTQQRSTGCPTLTAGHGSMVGGGVAYSLSSNMRGIASQTTIAFGNLSRGAVPGMHLSRTLPMTVGLSQAFSIYLTDSTISASAALKAQFAMFIARDPPQVKKEAAQLGLSIAKSPFLRKLPAIRDALPQTRFTEEATGINLGAKTGELFAAVKKGKVEDKDKSLAEIESGKRVLTWQELYADAALLHGPGADGGILAYAQSTSSRCWCTLEGSVAINKGNGKPKYSNKDWADKHAVAFNRVSSVGYFFPDATPAQMEVSTVAEAVAWCMWRERCYSVGLADSQGHNKIEVENAETSALFFEDPAEKFLGQEALWFQYIADRLSRNCTAATLAALIACIATPGVTLMFAGQEVVSFGRVVGKFAMHPGRQLTVEDIPNKTSLKVPSGDGLVHPHEWVFVSTSEQEWVIDICAAQFGDRTRSDLGVPLRILTKKEARVEYIEVERFEDPLDAFDKFWAELVDMQKQALAEQKVYTEAETFLMVSGKVCAMLGL